MVNWQDMADGSYLLDALPNAKKLGKIIGQKLVEMTQNQGFPLDKLHVVGHSLGGQLTGYVGRTVIENSEGKLKVPRISALDPAFPGFYPAVAATHLSYKDAGFVDIIHTDAWLYGTPTSTGSVDFWPNAGKTLQPGCPKRNYKMLSDIGKFKWESMGSYFICIKLTFYFIFFLHAQRIIFLFLNTCCIYCILL